ncbi:MAG: hypothetical protein R3D98_10610 [Candidatus Krumholzibacteriia bacterium]
MKALITFVAAMCLMAGLAAAQTDTWCYGWEDGGDTVGAYLPDNMYIANTTAQAFEGSASLEIYEIGGSSTPQAYVAWITGLHEGDQVTASIQTLDLIDGNPSCRIWGHWTLADGTIDDYAGSAGGNSAYSGGSTDWVELSYTWTAGAAQEGQGLVIEIRPYNGDPWAGSNWVDNLCVTKPVDAYLYFPGTGPVGTEAHSWTSVKSLF